MHSPNNATPFMRFQSNQCFCNIKLCTWEEPVSQTLNIAQLLARMPTSNYCFRHSKTAPQFALSKTNPQCLIKVLFKHSIFIMFMILSDHPLGLFMYHVCRWMLLGLHVECAYTLQEYRRWRCLNGLRLLQFPQPLVHLFCLNWFNTGSYLPSQINLFVLPVK